MFINPREIQPLASRVARETVPVPEVIADIEANPPRFLFRGGVTWNYGPWNRAMRFAKENVKPFPIPSFSKRVVDESSTAVIPSKTEQESLTNRILIYFWDEAEGRRQGGDYYIALDYVPRIVEVNPTSLMKSLNIVGLNFPKYHFGGGEDIITFEISWYGYGEYKHSVITKCRKIEALTKADGWKSGPPEIVIEWDEQNTLFENHVFVVEKAPYKLTNFQLNKNVGSEGSYEPFGLMPIMATQKLTLKRIAGQLTREEIIYPVYPEEKSHTSESF